MYSFRDLQTARSIKGGAFTPGTRLGGAPPPRGTESCRGRHSRCSFRTSEKLTVHVLVGVGRFCCRTHRIQTISFLDSADILELLPARGVGDKLLKLAPGNYCNISSCQVPFQHALFKRKTTGRREKLTSNVSFRLALFGFLQNILKDLIDGLDSHSMLPVLLISSNLNSNVFSRTCRRCRL